MYRLFFLLLLFPMLCFSQDTLKTKYFDVTLREKIVAKEESGLYQDGKPLRMFFGYKVLFANARKGDSVVIREIYVAEKVGVHKLTVKIPIDAFSQRGVAGCSFINLSRQESPNYGDLEVTLSSFPRRYRHYKGNCIIAYEAKGRKKYLLIKKLKEVPPPTQFPPLDEHLLH